MFHQERDILELLGRYTKVKEQKSAIKEKIIYKTIGKFNTKKQNKIIGSFIFYGIVFFTGYFIITNFQNKLEEKAVQEANMKNEKLNEIIKKDINQKEKTPIKNPPLPQNKPIEKIQKQAVKIEEELQNTTITLMPKTPYKKQEPIQKTEEEEIRPSTTTSISYYR